MAKERAKERIVYLNGQFVPESQAKISIFDSGFQVGYQVFDVARTFNKKPFKLREHINRLFYSLRYARIDPGLSPDEIEKISLEVFDRNKHLLGPNDEYWINQTISGGLGWPLVIPKEKQKATVAIYCNRIPFESWAKYYKIGVHAVIVSIRRVPSQCVDPKAKVGSRMNLELAHKEAELVDPNTYPLLLDLEGNITEGAGLNFFIVRKGELLTPGVSNILVGITRQTVIELAKEIGISVKECNLQPYDVYNADETFYTTTSRTIFPVTKVDGIKIGDGKPGPITKRLLKAWSDMVGIDIVQQALSHLEKSEVTR